MPKFSNRTSGKEVPRDVHYESVTKKQRRLNDIKTPEPSIRVAINKKNHPVEVVELVVAWSGADVWDIYHDHSYCFVAENDEIDPASKCNFQDGKPRPVSCQTDFTIPDIEQLEEWIKSLKATLSDKAKLKRDFFLEDVMKNDDSLKFYTGIPILGCFNMLVNLITPSAEKLKYWDKNKNRKN